MLSVWCRQAAPVSAHLLRLSSLAGYRQLSSMTAREIRKRYTEYFVRNGHKHLPSATIVPKNDPTLLFTNAGMVPFKQYFLNPSSAPHPMVATVQKCVRAGGKHNDLDQVGFTPRHHTFFEMLGNFSFGAYSKRDVIRMAWAFVRRELQMPEDMLRVTVLESDTETYEIWRDEIKLDPQRIVRCGPRDNFWSMGNEGPCGPCTEIFWDTRDPRYSIDDEERWLEFWNIVFMQYHRSASGQMTPLATPCVDTGMGLERVASIMQGKTNNFDTDEFQKIIGGIEQLQIKHGSQVGSSKSETAYRRVVADHLRASAFLISEGVRPDTTGRGYVLRRIIRRAFRAGRQLGIRGPVLPALYPSLVAAMGTDYPELSEQQEHISGTLQLEEEAFSKTLDRGLILLESIFARGSDNKVISGADAYVLYDTHGFPIDLTEVIARDHGWSVDIAEFEKIQMQNRQRNKASWKNGKKAHPINDEINRKLAEWQDAGVSSQFCGYDVDPEQNTMSVSSRVVAFSSLANGDGLAVIDPCPFYAQGGGQESDMGYVTVHGSNQGQSTLAVTHAVAIPGSRATALVVANAGGSEQQLAAGSAVTAGIDMGRRRGCAVHHTATHLLHAALRQVLGATVQQAGSLVRTNGLRFDFTSPAALTADQLCQIEQMVNSTALANERVVTSEMTPDAARSRGALALFGEKYSRDNVRVVGITDVSLELCGGTHVRTTRSIYPFQIISEGSIGAGTRRIEACAGIAASQWQRQQLEHARAAASKLNAPSLDMLSEKARRLSDQAQTLRSENEQWLRVAATNMQAAAEHATELGSIPARIHILPTPEDLALAASGDMRLAAEYVCHWRGAQPHTAHVAICGTAIALGLCNERFPKAQAGAMLRELLKRLPGKGGGQSTLAQGRLRSAASVDQIQQL
ncbi:hypothetical protein IWW40_001511 [Coemansia sp. RSA 1250]|nr:hypothetical protein IWW40_001511 [Coemansia sp. RSA 1250]